MQCHCHEVICVVNSQWTNHSDLILRFHLLFCICSRCQDVFTLVEFVLSAPSWGLLMSLNVACLLHMTEPSRSFCLGTLSRLICEKSWVKLLKVFRIWRSVLVRVRPWDILRSWGCNCLHFPGAKVFTKNLGCHGIVEYHWEGAVHEMFCGCESRGELSWWNSAVLPEFTECFSLQKSLPDSQFTSFSCFMASFVWGAQADLGQYWWRSQGVQWRHVCKQRCCCVAGPFRRMYSGQVALKLMREPSSPEEVKASFLFQQGNQLKMAKLSKTHTFFQPSFVYFKWCPCQSESTISQPYQVYGCNLLRKNTASHCTLESLEAFVSRWIDSSLQKLRRSTQGRKIILTKLKHLEILWPALRFGHEHGMKVMKMYRARRPGVSWILGNSSIPATFFLSFMNHVAFFARLFHSFDSDIFSNF